jgi:hypothetical protein
MYRGIDRNDPCPCGSGKKYKKCCKPDADDAPAVQVHNPSAPPLRTISAKLPEPEE